MFSPYYQEVDKDDAAKQAACAKINTKLEMAQQLVKEAEAIAKEAGVDFYWDGGAAGIGHFDESGEWGWSTSSIGC